MKKSHLILFIAGAFVALGMIASFYGTQMIRQGVTSSEGILNGTTIEVVKELDPSFKNTGSFFVVINGLEGENPNALVFDPDGNQIQKTTIEQEKTEKEFEIKIKGPYRLVLENSGMSGSFYILGLSHTPDTTTVALNYFGFWVMISGFIGVLVAVIYEIINRRKKIL
jgi:hypothetical protein